MSKAYADVRANLEKQAANTPGVLLIAVAATVWIGAFLVWQSGDTAAMDFGVLGLLVALGGWQTYQDHRNASRLLIVLRHLERVTEQTDEPDPE